MKSRSYFFIILAAIAGLFFYRTVRRPLPQVHTSDVTEEVKPIQTKPKMETKEPAKVTTTHTHTAEIIQEAKKVKDPLAARKRQLTEITEELNRSFGNQPAEVQTKQTLLAITSAWAEGKKFDKDRVPCLQKKRCPVSQETIIKNTISEVPLELSPMVHVMLLEFISKSDLEQNTKTEYISSEMQEASKTAQSKFNEETKRYTLSNGSLVLMAGAEAILSTNKDGSTTYSLLSNLLKESNDTNLNSAIWAKYNNLYNKNRPPASD